MKIELSVAETIEYLKQNDTQAKVARLKKYGDINITHFLEETNKRFV